MYSVQVPEWKLPLCRMYMYMYRADLPERPQSSHIRGAEVEVEVITFFLLQIFFNIFLTGYSDTAPISPSHASLFFELSFLSECMRDYPFYPHRARIVDAQDMALRLKERNK